MRAFRASAVLVLVLVAAGGAVPPCASACSCIPIGPITDYVADGATAVMAGTVGANLGGTRYAFVVERWYAGPGGGSIVTIDGGAGAMCGVTLTPGDRLVFAAAHDGNGTFSPSICAPFANVDTADGAALLAEADRVFGGQAPADDPSPAPAVPEPRPTREAGIPDAPRTPGVGPELVAAGAIALGIGVLVLAVLVARNRRANA
jgi:hypothetical protein